MEHESGSQRATSDVHASRVSSRGRFNPSPSLACSRDASSRESNSSESEIALYSLSQSVVGTLSSSSALRLPLKTLKDFVLLLQYSGIEGPTAAVRRNLGYLGKGSQFEVNKYMIVRPVERGFSTQLVAAKQPIYVFNPEQRLDLGNSDTKRQLHHLHLELVALTHPMLRAHPNIIDLIAWGREDQNWHHPLVLFMELAEYDLQALMSEKGSHMPWEHKYQICCDIAAGLDVIHDNTLVHGDLKPANVLICTSDGGSLKVKIADFGFCVDDEEADLAQRPIGTPGWQAPEIEDGQYLVRQLALADNFSYGLVVWSVFLLDGRCPPSLLFKSRSDAATQSFQQVMDEIPTSMQKPLLSVAQQLLQKEVSERPLRVSDVMAIHVMAQDESASTTDRRSEPESVLSIPNRLMPFEWELPHLSEVLVYDLVARFEESSTSLPGHLIFNLALHYSQDEQDLALLLRLMCAASSQGYFAAQNLLSKVFAYVDEPIPGLIHQHLRDYSANAVISGSLRARESLKALDHEAFTNAKNGFHDKGGFNQFYTRVESDTVHVLVNGVPRNRRNSATHGHNWIHWCAIYSSCQELKNYLSGDNDFDIYGRTSNGETALYLACARGSWDMAGILIGHGASPSVVCTEASVTCLHWLFAFDEAMQYDVASHLTEGGANINAISTMDMPIFHYPFILPRGSPLLWAVVMQCHPATAALLANGADPLLRCGNDPYVYDERIRVLDTIRDDRETCSVAEHPTFGLSSLDVAAKIGDPFIFQYLHESAACVDVNDTDEEGLAAIHRLTGPRRDRTLMGSAYDRKVFQGSKLEQRSSIKEVVSAIIKLGGNINMQVMPSRQDDATGGESSRIVGFTPLMLAMMEVNVDLIEILLERGANPQLTTSTNKTVLMCLGDPLHLSSSAAEHLSLNAVKLLVTHGADIHRRSAKNETAMLVAAYHNYILIIEYFLSQGADPDQVSASPHSKNMWTFLASMEISQDEDVNIANLLKRYVFPLTDLQKRNRILQEADEDGSSLLHYYARSGMINCVRALLATGCELNKPSRNIVTRSQDNGPEIRIRWRTTPLDMAVKGKDDVVDPARTGRFSPEYRGQLSQRMDAMVSFLREAGGIEIKESTTTKEEIDEAEWARETRGYREGARGAADTSTNDLGQGTAGAERGDQSVD